MPEWPYHKFYRDFISACTFKEHPKSVLYPYESLIFNVGATTTC